jgi:radical SAM protein with 4Fe4S-binding SPASM domain
MGIKRYIESVVESTREHIFIRDEDGVLIIKPNRVHNLNPMASSMLSRIYSENCEDPYSIVEQIANEYRVPEDKVASDLKHLLDTLLELLKNPFGVAEGVKMTPFGSHKRDLPVLSEIALTYGCNNKCVFCYASSPERVDDTYHMSTDEVKRILKIIRYDAKVPTVSFTGGEPTLRKDLPELISYAKSIDLRVNLISNGVLLSNKGLSQHLVDAGLDSAQISLESSIDEIHDKVVGVKGAFKKSVTGFRNLKELGIHCHINTTICKDNIDTITELPRFAHDELGLEYQSMNMVIRTGHTYDHPDEIGYKEIAEILPILHRSAIDAGIKLVWYSPIPYCIFNTIAEGIGGTSCAACDGLLSVAPNGDVLPCSSFSDGIGNLLTESFDNIWWNRRALYFRHKEFLPPVCSTCEHAKVCQGACPLYWDNRGNFDEIGGSSVLGASWWKMKRRFIGRSKPIMGVGK